MELGDHRNHYQRKQKYGISTNSCTVILLQKLWNAGKTYEIEVLHWVWFALSVFVWKLISFMVTIGISQRGGCSTQFIWQWQICTIRYEQLCDFIFSYKCKYSIWKIDHCNLCVCVCECEIPALAAICKADCPPLFPKFTSAPFLIKKLVMLVKPGWNQNQMNIFDQLSTAIIRRRRKETLLFCTPIFAAWWSGVFPWRSPLFTFAPLLINRSTAFSRPK